MNATFSYFGTVAVVTGIAGCIQSVVTNSPSMFFVAAAIGMVGCVVSYLCWYSR